MIINSSDLVHPYEFVQTFTTSEKIDNLGMMVITDPGSSSEARTLVKSEDLNFESQSLALSGETEYKVKIELKLTSATFWVTGYDESASTIFKHGRADTLTSSGGASVKTVPEAPGNSSDTTPPTVGGGGVLSVTAANVTSGKVPLTWTKATDNVSLQSQLNYCVYYSLQSDMDTIAEVEAKTLAGCSTSIEAMIVSNLQPGSSAVLDDGNCNGIVKGRKPVIAWERATNTLHSLGLLENEGSPSSGGGAMAYFTKAASASTWTLASSQPGISAGSDTSVAKRMLDRTDMALDKNGKIHMAIYENSPARVRYFTNSSGAWESLTVVPAGSMMPGLGLAVDSGDNNPDGKIRTHIIFKSDPNSLRDIFGYGTDSANWSEEIIAQNVMLATLTVSAQFDDANQLHVAYSNISAQEGGKVYLEYMKRSVSGTWSTPAKIGEQGVFSSSSEMSKMVSAMRVR